jgi:hypothetical protein
MLDDNAACTEEHAGYEVAEDDGEYSFGGKFVHG